MSANVDPSAADVEQIRLAEVTAGRDMWTTRALPELAVESLHLSDGPNGVRGPTRDERDTSRCTPCGTALGASWDLALVRRIGELIGREARRRQVQVVLGPTVNLHRTPLGGRGFEAYSEDPLLSGTVGASWVTGVQSTGVAACPKHLVANDQETSRTRTDCIVDPRALRELYLRPFELVLGAGAWAVMAAYNKLNGTHCSRHRELLTAVLREEWGWDGVVVSDWFAAYDTVASIRAGLDLEMPGPGRVLGPVLADSMRRHRLPLDQAAEAVARLRLLSERTAQPDSAGPEPAHRAEEELLVEAAAAGMVLLRNRDLPRPGPHPQRSQLSEESHPMLPLPAPARLSVGLIGPHAVHPCRQGGGSAAVNLRPMVSIAQALRDVLGPAARVDVTAGCAEDRDLPPWSRLSTEAGLDEPVAGWSVEYFHEVDGRPVLGHQEVRATSELCWDEGVPGMDGHGSGTVRATCRLTPATDGEHQFYVAGSGPTELSIDGVRVAELGALADPDDPQAAYFSDVTARGALVLAAGQPVVVTVEMRHRTIGDTLAVLRTACRPPRDPRALVRATDLAAAVDVAVVVVGTGPEREAESSDRTTTELSADQTALIEAVLDAQPSTVVVVNAGGAVALPWAGRCAALLYAWFPGDGFSQALADVLVGAREPGGRLPITLAGRDEDYPTLDTVPDAHGHLVYTESMGVGYRHFLAHDVEPTFSFGSGFGYTTFCWSDLRMTRLAGASLAFLLRLTVTNTGARHGKEVVQAYVEGPAPEPLRQLRAFTAVHLDPGTSAEVLLQLDRRAFTEWDDAVPGWRIPPGIFRIQLGRSCADVLLERTVVL